MVRPPSENPAYSLCIQLHKTLILNPCPYFEIRARYVYPLTFSPPPSTLTSPVPICYACDEITPNIITPHQELWFSEDRCPCDQSDDTLPVSPPLKREKGVSMPSLKLLLPTGTCRSSIYCADPFLLFPLTCLSPPTLHSPALPRSQPFRARPCPAPQEGVSNSPHPRARSI